MVRSIIVTILLLISFLPLFPQGEIDGYMKKGGDADIALSYTYEHFDKFWFGKEARVYPVTRQSYSLFVNQGITRHLNFIASVPYIRSSKGENYLQGLQDGAFFLKGLPWQKSIEDKGKFSLILAGGYRFPLENYATERGYAYGQKARSIEGRANLNYKWGEGNFIDIKSGYNYRFEPVPSSVPMVIKAGKGTAKVYYDFWLSYNKPIGGIDYPDRGPNNSFRELAVENLRAGGTYYLPVFNNFGAFLSGGYTLWGRNSGQAYFASIGVVYKSFRNKE